MKSIEEIVDTILKEIGDRSGFDGWWDSIDEDTQNEIKQDLINKISEI